jgi:hypothetical protein
MFKKIIKELESDSDLLALFIGVLTGILNLVTGLIYFPYEWPIMYRCENKIISKGHIFDTYANVCGVTLTGLLCIIFLVIVSIIIGFGIVLICFGWFNVIKKSNNGV